MVAILLFFSKTDHKKRAQQWSYKQNCLLLNYSAHLSLDVHCNSKVNLGSIKIGVMLPNIFTIISQQILCGKLFTDFNLDPIQTSHFYLPITTFRIRFIINMLWT